MGTGTQRVTCKRWLRPPRRSISRRYSGSWQPPTSVTPVRGSRTWPNAALQTHELFPISTHSIANSRANMCVRVVHVTRTLEAYLLKPAVAYFFIMGMQLEGKSYMPSAQDAQYEYIYWEEGVTVSEVFAFVARFCHLSGLLRHKTNTATTAPTRMFCKVCWWVCVAVSV